MVQRIFRGMRAGQYFRSLPLHSECLEIRRRILGDDHPDTLQSL